MHEVMEGWRPWQGLELRHLVALLAVAREGSFRGAADELGYVQSAVSQQLAGLERIVGARLVDRRRGTAPVRLTTEGDVLVGHFEEVLARIAAARADLSAASGDGRPRVRIGLSDRAATRLLAHAVRLLENDGERWQVELVESGDRCGHARLVESGDLEAAVDELPLPPGAFDRLELFSDPYVLLVPRSWPLAQCEAAVSAEVLDGLPLIGSLGGRLPARVEAELRLRSVRPKVVVHSDSDASVEALVAEEIGAAVLPRSAVTEPDERVAALPLGRFVTPRVVAFYWLRERFREPALAAFRQAVLAGIGPTASRRDERGAAALDDPSAGINRRLVAS